MYFRKSSRPRGVRLFFATDIHGSEACYRKFVNAGAFYDVSTLVLGGDIVGKLLIPITKHASGSYSARYGENDYQELGASALAQLTTEIRRCGHYYVIGDTDTLEELRDDPETCDRVFRRVVCESIERWVALAEDRLRGTGRVMFVAPGNDDFFDIDAVLSSSDVVEFAEARCISVDGFDMITTGFSNPTPWETDRELPEPELKKRIDAMAANARSDVQLLAVLHAPPFNSGIDSAPALDDELRMSISAGGIQMTPVGSTAVRAFIEERQPLLSLHGHVHEGKGIAWIGRTLVINPGSEYTRGVLSGVLIEIGQHEVLSHQFVTG